jgi:uncharacterized damage-inducible protein DinB
MSGDKLQLERLLKQLNEKFDRELRARGFDPSQAETIALPGALVTIFIERQLLLEKLSDLHGTTSKENYMMTEVERILDQFRRAFDGEAWHGPSVLSLLSDVNAAQAFAHPIPSAHSIWELVLHITAWERACKRRLAGDRAQLSDEENFPPVRDSSVLAWEGAQQKLVQTHHELLEAIATIDDLRLDQPIISDPSTQYSTLYVTLHGVIQHDLYHAGQIAILKKAV